jgi:hypothetical protein
MKLKDIDLDQDIIHLSRDASASLSSKVRVVKHYTTEDLTATFRAFAGEDGDEELQATGLPRSIPVYEHDDMPGREATSLVEIDVSCSLPSTSIPIPSS